MQEALKAYSKKIHGSRILILGLAINQTSTTTANSAYVIMQNLSHSMRLWNTMISIPVSLKKIQLLAGKMSVEFGKTIQDYDLVIIGCPYRIDYSILKESKCPVEIGGIDRPWSICVHELENY